MIEFEGEVYPLSWGAADDFECKGLYEHTIRLLPTSLYLLTHTDRLVYLEGSYSVPKEGVIEREISMKVTHPSILGFLIIFFSISSCLSYKPSPEEVINVPYLAVLEGIQKS